MFSFHFHDALSFICLIRNSSASTGDIPSEDAEDLSAAVQDAEICLLKSGELTCVSVKVICAYNTTFDFSAEEEVSVNVLSLIESENVKY